MTQTLLAKKVKGNMSQYEDWWYLVEKDGSKSVVHEWDHVELRGMSSNRGEKSYSIEEFLAGNHYGAAKAELERLLKDGDRVGNG
ncbi:MAG: hypothetical protein JSR13_13970 [Proteobacteria bacterium]|nr:hypothetical protein [Pseudomonadota bacterium]